jgi:mannose-6-phosphate isomerase-like protein (cupin superfamily)
MDYKPGERAIEVSDGLVQLKGGDRGTEEVLFSGAYMVKRLVLLPAAQTSMHFHYAKCETLIVVAGSLAVCFDQGGPVYLGPGDHLSIREGRIHAHRMTAGPNGCEFIECSTPHPGDSERLYP